MKHKGLRVAMAFGVAIALALAMAAPAWAGDASITIHRDDSYSDVNQDSGTTYDIYKIFDASYSANNASDSSSTSGEITNSATSANYTIAASSPWVGVLGTFNGNTFTPAQDQVWVTLSKTVDASTYQVKATSSLTNESQAKAFAKWLMDHKGSIGVTEFRSSTGDTISFDNLDRGYYLISSTVGANLVLATTNLNIHEKNSYPDAVKTTATAADKSVQIGGLVNYTITITVPAGADKQMVLTDTMSAGLTFNQIESVIPYKGSTAGAGLTQVTNIAESTDTSYVLGALTSTDSGSSFTITIPESAVKKLVKDGDARTIVVSYSAYLNGLAVVQEDEGGRNTNTVTLAYGSYVTRPSGSSPNEDAHVTTERIKVRKFDRTNNNMTPIAGAVFQLRLADGTTVVKLIKTENTAYRVADHTEATGTAASHAGGGSAVNNITAGSALVSDFVTVSGSGNEIIIDGLDADVEYKLVELQAPAGYNLLSSMTTVQPATDSIEIADIQNAKGTLLPSTGSMGTAQFYVIGGVLAALAFVSFAARQRMKSA